MDSRITAAAMSPAAAYGCWPWERGFLRRLRQSVPFSLSTLLQQLPKSWVAKCQRVRVNLWSSWYYKSGRLTDLGNVAAGRCVALCCERKTFKKRRFRAARERHGGLSLLRTHFFRSSPERS